MYRLLEPLRLFGRVLGLIIGSHYTPPADETVKRFPLYQIFGY